MEWLALSISLLGTIHFAIHYRGFRRVLMYATGGMVVLAALAATVILYNNHQREDRRQVASTLIRPDQIEILDAELTLGTFPQLRGNAINRSGYELAELAVKVTVTDCPQNLFEGLGRSDHDTITLNIEGQRVRVDDSFLSLSPDEQNAAVDEIAASFGGQQRPARDPGAKFNPKPAPKGMFDHLIPKQGDATAKAPDKTQCGVVGENVTPIYSINVPPQQKRAFEASVALPKLPEMKDWSWRYSIEQAIAKH